MTFPFACPRFRTVPNGREEVQSKRSEYHHKTFGMRRVAMEQVDEIAEPISEVLCLAQNVEIPIWAAFHTNSEAVNNSQGLIVL